MRRHFTYGKVLILVGVFVAIGSCAEKNSTGIDGRLAAVISVDDKIAMNDRGYFVPKRETLEGYSPTKVNIQPRIERDVSGSGFRLRFSWAFEGDSPKYWIVRYFSDDNAGSDPEFERASKDVNSGPLEYESSLLSGGRTYRFQLIAYSRNDAVNQEGEIIYKTLTVNLRGIE